MCILALSVHVNLDYVLGLSDNAGTHIEGLKLTDTMPTPSSE